MGHQALGGSAAQYSVKQKECENVQQPTPKANSNNLKCHSVLIGKLDDEEEQKVASIGRNCSDRTNPPSFSDNDRFFLRLKKIKDKCRTSENVKS